MDNKKYKVEDFLLDETFVADVKSGEIGAFWQAYFNEYPKQRVIAEQARNMILKAKDQIDEPQKARLKTRILDKIKEEEAIEIAKVKRLTMLTKVLAVAASIALMVAAWFLHDRITGDSSESKLVYQELVKKAETPLLEVYNNSEKPKLIMLDDNSTVLLEKDSRLSYPKSFDGVAQRKVYLSGEAFFEVVKDPEKPFMVYGNEIVTKVLGTSFNVKAFPGDKDIVVTVKNGKVAVFINKENPPKEEVATRNTEGVVLTPNQQIVFTRRDAQLLKSLVQSPAMQKLPAILKMSFEFDDTPVSQIFELLEKAYGVDIVYDEELLNRCILTGSMTDEPLFEKLKLICIAIEAEYEIIDAQIVIQSRGCISQ